jgi:protein phosphatase
MNIILPAACLVVLIGALGAGKTTFAQKHFRTTEILSSDLFRALISNDENEQSVSREAFIALHFILEQRLKLGKLTVVDATNTIPEHRQVLLHLAAAYQVIPVAIVFNLPLELCCQRNLVRLTRQVDSLILYEQYQRVQQSLSTLPQEGFASIYFLDSSSLLDVVQIIRQPAN